MVNALEYIAQLSAIQKSKANKLLIRELEEETKNVFIAFVDDKSHSFDVKIKLVENQIMSASCDCESNETFCIHKTAVVLNLLEKEPKKVIKSSRKKKIVKINEAQEILKQLNQNDINNWLSMVLSQNKEIEMQFLLQFSKKTLSYETADVEKLIGNSFTSIMLKRKKIELNELKKILEILNKVLAPVFDYIQTQITQKNGLNLLIGLVDTLIIQESKYSVPGTRYPKYIHSVIEKFALLLNQVQDEDAWEKQVKTIVDDFFNTTFSIGFYATDLLTYTHAFAQPKRKKFISACIKKNLLEYIDKGLKLRLEFNEVLLDIVIENNDFETVKTYFTIYPYQNQYNLKFLNALKNVDSKLTIDYCRNCIVTNTKIEHNLPYLIILEELLEKQKNFTELAIIKHNKFLIEPNFDDYKFVMLHFKDKEYLGKFRNNTLSRFRNLFYKENIHIDIYFKILNDEQNYNKMQEVIKHDIIPLRVLNQYLDILFTADRVSLLQSILKRLLFIEIEEETDNDFDATKIFISNHYAQNESIAILNDLWTKSYSFYPQKLKLNIIEKLKR